MSKSYIPKALRQQVIEHARNRCGYCQTQAEITGQPLQIDHILPEAVGGKTEIANLWLACVACNQRKAYRTHALDPQSEQIISLFNPATELWSVHFQWSQDGAEMVGLTASTNRDVNGRSPTH